MVGLKQSGNAAEAQIVERGVIRSHGIKTEWRAAVRAVGLAPVVAGLVAAVFSWGTLCLGEDGHVAFELAVNGDCVAGGDTARTVSTNLLGGVRLDARWPCCGPCTDFGAPGDGWIGSVGAAEPDPVPSLAEGLALTTAGTRPPAARVRWTESDAFRVNASTLSTIVLRC